MAYANSALWLGSTLFAIFYKQNLDQKVWNKMFYI